MALFDDDNKEKAKSFLTKLPKEVAIVLLVCLTVVALFMVKTGSFDRLITGDGDKLLTAKQAEQLLSQAHIRELEIHRSMESLLIKLNNKSLSYIGFKTQFKTLNENLKIVLQNQQSMSDVVRLYCGIQQQDRNAKQGR